MQGVTALKGISCRLVNKRCYRLAKGPSCLHPLCRLHRTDSVASLLQTDIPLPYDFATMIVKLTVLRALPANYTAKPKMSWFSIRTVVSHLNTRHRGGISSLATNKRVSYQISRKNSLCTKVLGEEMTISLARYLIASCHCLDE